MKTKINLHVPGYVAHKRNLGAALLLVLILATLADAQLTPSDDAYVNSAAPTTNYGAATTLDLSSAADTAFIQFDLTAVPAGTPGSSIAKATLKLYVNSVTTAGSFNVDYVTGTWVEKTIKYSLQPAIGTTIASSVPLTTASKGKYVEIDVTAAMVEWLNGSQANDGIALVANSPLVATFDSKENTTTSHPAELDIVFAGGTITGVTTASGSGLMGGGASGTLNLSLTNACAANQVLKWNGTAWVCANLSGSGTITGVTAGTDLTGGGTTGKVTLNLDTTKVPQLNTVNTFTIGQAITTSGNIDGLDSFASGSGYAGVLGFATATTGGSPGVIGITEDASGYGVYGANGAGGIGVFGQGVTGVFGSGVYAVSGQSINGGSGAVGASYSGVVGTAQTCCIGVGGLFYGYSGSSNSGNNGTAGIASTGGYADPNDSGYLSGGDGIDSTGGSVNNGLGGNGGTFTGGNGTGTASQGGEGGSFAGGNGGVIGGDGVYGQSGSGAFQNGYAGNFHGDLAVTGAIYAGTKDFKIDHPLDPANKYLVHASVESSEMMNIYTGNVTTDTQGLATVRLPAWFEALNTDFRYQLTVIGQFAEAIIASKIANHQFTIKTNAPNVEVSWQVTGVRQDAYAKAHPLVVEAEKDARTQGFYIHPELYGAPEEKQIEWARHPEMMKRLKERRQAPHQPILPIALPTTPKAPALPIALQRALKKK
jgi:hypothetical protein